MNPRVGEKWDLVEEFFSRIRDPHEEEEEAKEDSEESEMGIAGQRA